MTRHQPGVKEIVDSPCDGEEVSLIVGVKDTEDDKVRNLIEEAGGTIEEALPLNSFAISIKEHNVPELSKIPHVESIEIEGVWEGEEGNLNSQTSSHL